MAGSAASPLQQYVALQRPYDAEMRRVLREASAEAERIVLSYGSKGGFDKVRMRRAKADLDRLSLSLYGQVDGLTTRGVRAAAKAAANSENYFGRVLAQRYGAVIPEWEKALGYSAENGITAMLAKEANAIPLSQRVYRARAFTDDALDRQLRRDLLLQKSAAQIAKGARDFIDPSTPGGVSYAANRLARTEINNAFHTQQVSSRSEEPWTEAFQWHLSGSHRVPDDCNRYASNVNFKGGEPGQFQIGNVPNKPHPNCLCYVTTVTIDEDEFVDRFVAGQYNGYIDSRIHGSGIPVSSGITIREPFRGVQNRTDSISAAYQAKHLRFGDQTEAAWEASRVRGEAGVLWGKHLDDRLYAGDQFISDRGERITYSPGLRKFRFHRTDKSSFDLYDRYDLEDFVVRYRMRQVGTPTPSVNPISPSPGTLTDEDAAILFVKTKDDIARDKGIPIKGATPVLDRLVYESIADHTGYSAAEVEAKIAAYRGSGKKLSGLKKRVLADDSVYRKAMERGAKKKVIAPPEPSVPKKVTPPSPKPEPVVRNPFSDPPAPRPTTPPPQPAPKTLPKKASTPLKKNIVDDVKAKINSGLKLTDEDVVKVWVKAKEAIAQNPLNKFTLYSKGPDFEFEFNQLMRSWGLYNQGIDHAEVEYTVARFTRGGGKVSAIKKKMIRSGEFDDVVDAVTDIPEDLFPEFGKFTPATSNVDDIYEDSLKINPHYGSDQQWGVNCTHVVTTYELRRRGIRVQAMPRPEGHGRKEGDWLTDRWTTAEGKLVTSDYVAGYNALRRTVRDEWPEGARGVMTVGWKQGGAHVFNVEKVNGQMIFIDAQIHKAYRDEFGQRGLIGQVKSGKMWLVRLDDKVPNDRVKELVASESRNLRAEYPGSGFDLEALLRKK